MGALVQVKDAMITCVTCGLTYSVSQGRASCARCPLHEDCSTSCCPKCGTSNINPDKSRLARWLEKVLSKATPADEPVEALDSSHKIRTMDFGVAQHPVERWEGVSDPALRQAQGTEESVAETDEALDSSSKIRTMDFGVAPHPVERLEGALDPAIRQAQGTEESVAEPVEALNSSSKIRTMDFGVAPHPVERLEGALDPALRQAQGTDEALNSSPKIRTMDFGGGREGVPVSTPVEARQAQGAKKPRTLADVQPGREVQITGYGELNSSQRQHLQAYGLLPGRRVKVLSQHPVTIVQVEQTELAFERGIAARVLAGD